MKRRAMSSKGPKASDRWRGWLKRNLFNWEKIKMCGRKPRTRRGVEKGHAHE